MKKTAGELGFDLLLHQLVRCEKRDVEVIAVLRAAYLSRPKGPEVLNGGTLMDWVGGPGSFWFATRRDVAAIQREVA